MSSNRSSKKTVKNKGKDRKNVTLTVNNDSIKTEIEMTPIKKGSVMPEEGWPNAPEGGFWVNVDSGEAWIFVRDMGWVALGGWAPDVGEGEPTKNNPPDPQSGDQYIDLYTGDFYYYVDGLGWRLMSETAGKSNNMTPEVIEGPQGPVGKPGFADLFLGVKEEDQLITVGRMIGLKWELIEFQDDDYEMEIDYTMLKVENRAISLCRYLLKGRLIIEVRVVDGREGEIKDPCFVTVRGMIKRDDQAVIGTDAKKTLLLLPNQKTSTAILDIEGIIEISGGGYGISTTNVLAGVCNKKEESLPIVNQGLLECRVLKDSYFRAMKLG